MQLDQELLAQQESKRGNEYHTFSMAQSKLHNQSTSSYARVPTGRFQS